MIGCKRAKWHQAYPEQRNPGTAIVVGGASGIGRALAELLSKRGYVVHILDINSSISITTAASITSKRGTVIVHILDVGDNKAFSRTISEIEGASGCPDYFFNCAGRGHAAEVCNTSYADWKRIIQTNLFGIINGISAVYPIMKAERRGIIVNVSSLTGLVPSPGQAAYSAAKHGVIGLSLSLAAEARAYGVQVSVVCPGIIDTNHFDNMEYIGFDARSVQQLFPVRKLSSEKCARLILRRVDRGQELILVHWFAHALWGLFRMNPSVFMIGARHAIAVLRSTKTK